MFKKLVYVLISFKIRRAALPPTDTADRMVLCLLFLVRGHRRGKQGAFSFLLQFKSLGHAGKQKELICIDNTVDLVNRASPFLPVSLEKTKERKGKTQSKKYRNLVMEEVPYTLSPDHNYHSPPYLHMDPRVDIKKGYGGRSAEGLLS